jgi:hypothetical protein
MKTYAAIVAMGLVLSCGTAWSAEAESSQASQRERTLGAEFARGVISPVLSVVYFPVKLSVGVAGAIAGGVSGWATGGNERAAEGVWRPLTGGSYFVTPETLEKERPFLPLDGGEYAQP